MLPLLLLFLDPTKNYARGPGLGLPTITLAVLAALAAFAVLDNVLAWDLLAAPKNDALRAAFFAMFAAALIPRFWNAANFAKFDADQRADRAKRARETYIRDQLRRYPHADRAMVEQQIDENDQKSGDASLGALVATFVVAVIGIVAFVVGNGTSLSMRGSFGFFLCFAFIGIFVVVVFVDVLSEWSAIRWLGRVLDGLSALGKPFAGFYKWVDWTLVRIGAAAVGMGHRNIGACYCILVGTMSVLTVTGLYLPPPFGLIPAFAGFAFAIAVSRLWNWVEDDRALAALTGYKETAPYQTDLREGSSPSTSLAVTRLSEQPIQRYFGDCCSAMRKKNVGSSQVLRCAQATFRSKSLWSAIRLPRSATVSDRVRV